MQLDRAARSARSSTPSGFPVVLLFPALEGFLGSAPERSVRPLSLATGSRPRSIPGYEFDGNRVVSSREALDWTERPQRVAIIGAGAIGSFVWHDVDGSGDVSGLEGSLGLQGVTIDLYVDVNGNPVAGGAGGTPGALNSNR